MDKKLLDALQYLGDGLEELSRAIQEKNDSAKSSTGLALSSGDFGKQLESISEGIKSIKEDTSKILEKQDAILAQAKSSDKKTNEVEGSADPKKESAIKKGVGTILLIAVAVLAIGMAFKLVGDVDFLSVVGLALAITLIAVAFEKISKLGLSLKEASITSATLVIMSIAILASSYILGMIQPITITQGITAILIAGVFAVVAFGLNKMLSAFKGMSMDDVVKAVIFLPLILPVIALAIALSSGILGMVKPLSLANFFGAIMTGAIFAVMAFGLKWIISAFKDIDPGTAAVVALMMPILFVGMSMAIMYSSEYLSKVTPIKFDQFLVSLGIAILFIPLGFAASLVVKAIDGMKWGSVFKLPIFFTLMSVAIAASAYVLSQSKEYIDGITFGMLLKVGILGVTLAIVSAIMSVALRVMSKIPEGEIIKGAFGIILVAGVIMITSHILSLGNYDKYPDWKWALGVGLSIIAVVPALVVLGSIAMSGVGSLALLAGAGMVLVVAGTIVAASHILDKGKYDKYPDWKWSMGVALSLGAFAAGMGTLGAIIVGSFGLGAVALAAGSEAVLMVAQTIVDASHILDKGKYGGGPTLEWAGGIAIALGAFAPIYAMMMASKILDFIGMGVSVDDFSTAIKTISSGIAEAAVNLNKGEGFWKGGPSKEWAEGISIALGAFAPIYGILLASKVLGGVSASDFVSGIQTISEGIVAAATYFGKNVAVFDLSKVPKKEWGESVGSAIGAFAPVFKALSEDTGFFTSSDDVMNGIIKGIVGISKAIVRVATIFAGGPEVWLYPSKTWSSGVKSSIQSFFDLNKMVSKFKGNTWAAASMANKMVNMAKILHSGKDFFANIIDPQYIKNVGQNMLDFNDLVNQLVASESAGSNSITSIGKSLIGADPISQIASRMVTLAHGYDKLATSLTKLATAMKLLNITNASELGGITKGIVGGSSNDNISSPKSTGVSSVKSPTETSTTQKTVGGKNTMESQLDRIISILSNIDKSATSLNDIMMENSDSPTTTADAGGKGKSSWF